MELILLQFSTGEYHPLARYPRITLQDFPSSVRPPEIALEIVGDNLALVIFNATGNFRIHKRFRDKLFIFDWKAGHKKLVRYFFPIFRPTILTFLDSIMKLRRPMQALFSYPQKSLSFRMSLTVITKSGKSQRRQIMFHTKS